MKRTRALATLGLTFLIHGSFGAALAATAADPGGARIESPSDPATVVVRYTERIGEIGNTDLPTLTVYADGRAVVHWPEYTKRRGDYELRLTAAEMDDLLALVVSKGALTFDADATTAAKRAAETQRAGAGGSNVVASDDTSTVIEINVDRAVSGAAGARSVARVSKTISWRGARTDARLHPEITAITDLAALEDGLRALMRRAAPVGR